MTHQSGRFADRLGNQHSIERIAVMLRQCFCSQSMRHRNLQFDESALCNHGVKITGSFELSQTSLDGNFPARDRTDKDCVLGVGNPVACRSRDQHRIVAPPKQYMRIKEQPHSMPTPKASARSGGSLSKSSAITTQPFHIPPCRFDLVAFGSTNSTFTVVPSGTLTGSSRTITPF